MMPVTPTLEQPNMFDQARTVGSDSEFSPPNTPDMKATGKHYRTLIGQSPDLSVGIDGLAGIKPIQPTFRPSDENIPDNYVTATIAKTKYLPPVTWKNLIWNIQWISFLAITITPAVALYGLSTTPVQRKTLIWR